MAKIKKHGEYTHIFLINIGTLKPQRQLKHCYIASRCQAVCLIAAPGEQKKGRPDILRQPLILNVFPPSYLMAILRAGFALASSFFGMFTLRTPFLWEAVIFSASTVSGMVKERLNLL